LLQESNQHGRAPLVRFGQVDVLHVQDHPLHSHWPEHLASVCSHHLASLEFISKRPKKKNSTYFVMFVLVWLNLSITAVHQCSYLAQLLNDLLRSRLRTAENGDDLGRLEFFETVVQNHAI
jgi:hypothetical protein